MCGCRLSYFVKLRHQTSQGAEVLYIAKILHFVKATNSEGASKRLAACQLFQASLQGEVRKASVARPMAETFMIEIDLLDAKLVTARHGTSIWGMLYGNTSGMA